MKLKRVFKNSNILLITFIIFLLIQAFDQSFGWGMNKLYPEFYSITFGTQLEGWSEFIWFENGLIEHELDHVFIGFSDLSPKINQDEVCDFKYVDEQEIEALLKENSNSFSPWFKICYKKAIKHANTFSVKQLIA